MNVKELKEAIKDLPDDMPVLTDAQDFLQETAYGCKSIYEPIGAVSFQDVEITYPFPSKKNSLVFSYHGNEVIDNEGTPLSELTSEQKTEHDKWYKPQENPEASIVSGLILQRHWF